MREWVDKLKFKNTLFILVYNYRMRTYYLNIGADFFKAFSNSRNLFY